jgi:hypothetical protein
MTRKTAIIDPLHGPAIRHAPAMVGAPGLEPGTR